MSPRQDDERRVSAIDPHDHSPRRDNPTARTPQGSDMQEPDPKDAARQYPNIPEPTAHLALPTSSDRGTDSGSAAAAGKPGAEVSEGQPASEAALEANAQNLPVGPDGRRSLDVIDVRKGMFGVSGSGDTSGYGGLVRTVAMHPEAQRPYGGWYDEAVDILAEVLEESGTPFSEAIEKVVIDRGELTLFVRREHLVEVCQILRDDQDLRFELSLGVSGVHYPNEKGRELHSVMHLVSVTHNRRLRLETAVPEDDPHLPSTTSVYPTNDWHEREAYDFFGLVYDGHPGLARIQMPDDWPGHPQRKDYPLGGIPVEYKGATIAPPDQRRSYN